MSIPQSPTEVEQPNQTSDEFNRLVKIVQKLRGPDGCPWDREQTQKSLCQFAIEEAFELVEAIETGKQQEICEELGDFLFQVILQAQVAQDQGSFELKDVIKVLNDKMVYRHPHVFGNTGPRSLEQVWQHWDKLKAQEQVKPKALFNYPRTIPALQAAHKIGVKTKGFEFDWQRSEEVLAKIDEEVAELKEAIASRNEKHIEHELGDVLFSLAQLARHLKLEAEQSLREGNRRFERRFNEMMKISELDKDQFRLLSPEKKEQLWQLAKNNVASSES